MFLVLGEVIGLVRDAIAEQGGPRGLHLRAAEYSFHLFCSWWKQIVSALLAVDGIYVVSTFFGVEGDNSK